MKRRRVHARRGLLVGLLLSVHSPMVSVATSSWTPIANMPRVQVGHESITLPDGRVLIVGPGSAADLFQPATGGFAATGSSRFGHGNGMRAVRLLDGRALVTGGWGALRKAEIYDPASGTFNETGELQHPHAFHTLTVMSDGRVLVAGGQAGPFTAEHDVAEIFDPTTGTFTLTGSLKCGRNSHAAALLPDGRVLVVGGSLQTQPGFSTSVRSAEIFDPGTGAFIVTGSMMIPRTEARATPLPDGRVLVFGWGGNSAEVFDPATGAFQEVGGMSVAHNSATATRLADGRVLIAGGYVQVGPVVTDIAELYWPDRQAFSRTAPMTSLRQQHAAALLADGRVLVTGGSYTSLLRSAEVYTPGDEAAPRAMPAGPPIPRGRIEGRVVDEATGLPIPGVFVRMASTTGGSFALGKTNPQGEFYGDAGLPAGNYHLGTSNNLGYVDEAYGDVPCAGCDPRSGTVVPVPADTAVVLGDIALARGPQIRGRVTGEDTGVGLAGVFVDVLNASGRLVSSVVTDGSGDYSNGAGLPPGDYYVRTRATWDPYIDELHRDVSCPFICDFSTGEPVPVSATTAPEVDFVLARGGAIAGSILDGATGASLSGVSVQLFDATGRPVGNQITSFLAPPYRFGGLPAGTFHLRTANSLGYVNEVFDGRRCLARCDATSGDPVAVVLGATTPANFVIERDGDDDGDGIVTTVDKNAVSGADESTVFSSDFSDVPLGGGTSGAIADRGGWTVEVGDVAAGLSATLARSGTTPAFLDTCAAGDPERIVLDAADESATFTCLGSGGSTAATASLALPFVQLRKPVVGPGIVVDLPTAHTATLGSPVTAGSQNVEAITVRFVDGEDETFGSFALDPGESVNASVHPDGSASATVLVGTIVVEVRGDTAVLRAGDTRIFPAQDQTPPVVAPRVEGPLGAGGWYVGDVRVTWSVEDAESAIAGSNGCGAMNLTSDTAAVTFTCTATSAGGTTSASVTVKRDATSPAIGGLPRGSCTLWPPDNKLVPVALVRGVDATAGLAGRPLVTVASNEPVDAGRHDQGPDWLVHAFGPDKVVVWLRRERAAGGTGRVYTVEATATDSAGNTASASGTCRVPAPRHGARHHGRRGGRR